MMGNHVRCSADGGSGVVTVLGYLIARTCNHETAGGRDVEGVLAVAACSYYVDVAVAVENGRYTRLKNAVAEAKQLVDGHTAHLQTCEQCRDLLVGIFTLGDTNQYGLHLLAGELFVVKEAEEVAFHCLFHIGMGLMG